MSRGRISTPCACAQASRSSWVKVSPLSRLSLPRKLGHVEQDAAADDAALRDRLDAGLVQTADRGACVVAVPDLPAVPDVAEAVVLRRALQEGVDLVVSVVQAARVGGTAGALVPVRLVEDLRALGGRAARPDGVAVRVADQALQREDLPGAHQADGGEDLLGTEVVQRADLVVGPPLAPVARGVLQQVAEEGCFGGLRHCASRSRGTWACRVPGAATVAPGFVRCQ